MNGMTLTNKWSLRFWIFATFAELVLIVALGIQCIDNVQYFRSLEKQLLELRVSYRISANQIAYQDKMLGIDTLRGGKQ